VVASYTGFTAEQFKGEADLNIVVVRGAYGFRDANEIRMSEEEFQALTAAGIKVVTAAHALSGGERALSSAYKGIYPVEIIAHTLRMFGQGTKVCVECAAMACDSGAVLSGAPTIAVGGTAAGADTVMLLQPANTHRILETRICEFFCKPAF
jgi:hypothetical protein